MSDFYGCLESTSFRVKDRAAFMADPDVVVLREHASNEEGFWHQKNEYFSFGWYDQYPSIVLTVYYNDFSNESRDVDIAETIRNHILPGDVCQIGISGNEKLRYIGGAICWVTSKGIIMIDGQTCWENQLTENSIRGIVEKLAKETDGLIPPLNSNQTE